jgi:hypothetical protein
MQWRRWPAETLAKGDAVTPNAPPPAGQPMAATPAAIGRPVKLTRYREAAVSPPSPPPLARTAEPDLKRIPPAQIEPSDEPELEAEQGPSVELSQSLGNRDLHPLAPRRTAENPTAVPALLTPPSPQERVAPLKGNPLRHDDMSAGQSTAPRALDDTRELGRPGSLGQVNVKWRGSAVAAQQPSRQPAGALGANRQAAFEINAGNIVNPLRGGAASGSPPGHADDGATASNWNATAASALAGDASFGSTGPGNPLRSH